MTQVLVVGSGGSSKLGYLDAIIRRTGRVLVADTILSAPPNYPAGVTSVMLSSFDQESLDDFCRRIEADEFGEIHYAASILESCVEAVGYVRDRLKLPGLGLKKSMLFRDKALMTRYGQQNDIPFPRTAVLSTPPTFGTLEIPGPWVLKPTTGSANVGVRVVRSAENLHSEYAEAQSSVRMCADRYSDLSSIGEEWLVSEYIEGKEVEVDLYVVRGEIQFMGVHEKTLVSVRGSVIQEDNATTPACSLTSHQSSQLRDVCARLASGLHEQVFNPSGVLSWTLYAEFIVGNSGPVCLEFANRIGGGWVPQSLYQSTGVPLFDIAAASTIGELVPIQRAPEPQRAVYWQLLYQNEPGWFMYLDHCSNLNAEELPFVAARRTRVRVPSSEAVACVFLVGESSDDVFERARQVMSRIEVVSEDLKGNQLRHPVPVPEIRALAR